MLGCFSTRHSECVLDVILDVTVDIRFDTFHNFQFSGIWISEFKSIGC